VVARQWSKGDAAIDYTTYTVALRESLKSQVELVLFFVKVCFWMASLIGFCAGTTATTKDRKRKTIEG
jgi:hypothetical protein